MNTFTQQLPTEKGDFYFNFSKVETLTVHKYFVQVFRNDTIMVSFEMKRNELKEWKAIQPVPDYILKIEKQVAAVIEKQYNGNV